MLDFAVLPPDCLLKIFQSLSIQDLVRLGATCKGLYELEKDDQLWKNLARQKWGSILDTLITQPTSWREYCLHRLATFSLRPSPINLIQEQYNDPWQHIVCCILCSRTTGGPLIRETINNFLLKWPTPTDIIEAREYEIFSMIHALGLQASRCAAVKSMSRDFLEQDWKDPNEFKGCGKFTSDSFKIFCRGYRQNDVTDCNLQRYLRWVLGNELKNEKPEKKSTKMNKPIAKTKTSKKIDKRSTHLRKAVGGPKTRSRGKN